MRGVILIVEDEPDLVAPLEFALQNEGYQTKAALDGAMALALASEKPLPDLVLLDLMLPDLSGVDVCRQLKAAPATAHIPVIMVSAMSEEIHRVLGFEVGADDYVVKPFSMREILLRVRAVLRRAQPVGATTSRRSFGSLTLDEEAHKAWVDGQEVSLTVLEFKLLTNLLEQRGRVQTRQTLLEKVWEMNADTTTRTVDTHIKRLRQKLGEASSYVETVRGVGYRFRAIPEGDRR